MLSTTLLTFIPNDCILPDCIVASTSILLVLLGNNTFCFSFFSTKIIFKVAGKKLKGRIISFVSALDGCSEVYLKLLRLNVWALCLLSKICFQSLGENLDTDFQIILSAWTMSWIPGSRTIYVTDATARSSHSHLKSILKSDIFISFPNQQV